MTLEQVLPQKRKHLYLSRARFLATLCSALVLFLSGACASAGGASKSAANNSTQITLEEIESSHQPTLLDVVQALRPMWLRQASTAIAHDQDTGISVYLDEQRAGGLDILRQLPATAASSLRYYGASEAQSRFGLGNLHGVIQITSARGPRSAP